MNDTLSRGELQNLPIDSIFLEMQALKLAHDATVTDFAATALICIYGLVEPSAVNLTPFKPTKKHLASLGRLIRKWSSIFSRFVRDDKDRTHILHGIEKASLHSDHLFLAFFRFTLQLFYDNQVLTEDVILDWEEQRRASKSSESLQLLESASEFLDWLKDAESEDDSDEDDD